MKYIFMAGAPGSKWSSVSKNIYDSADIDRSDYHDDRTYYHDASGEMQLMHQGAYFDPGMEFGRALKTQEYRQWAEDNLIIIDEKDHTPEGVRAHMADLRQRFLPMAQYISQEGN